MSSFHVQTLANSIIGTAILSMPYCFAKVSLLDLDYIYKTLNLHFQCGVILSIFLLVASTIITRSCCHYLIKASIVTRRRNMEQLGFHMFGTAGKTLVEISVIGFLMGTCVAFYVVIGDLSPVIISKVFNVQRFSHDSVRRFLIILITLTCVIPLCFQKSIESLSFVCRASIGFYICLTVKTVFESFERFESGSDWASSIDLWKPSGVLQCIPIFSMAMSCQMQLFEVYETMGFPASFDRIKQTVHQATSICCVVYCIVGFFGYLAFNNQTLSGNILMNFSPSMANDAITIGFILSIACSFPLVIFPCRAALASFLHRKSFHSEIAAYVPEPKYQPLTLFIIFSTMIVGILIPSVEVIISLVGSTIGVLVCILFPATCFVKIMQRNSAEKTFAQLIIVVGFIIMILGTYANLTAIESTQSGSHLFEKPFLDLPVVNHPKDTHNVQPVVVVEPKPVAEKQDTVKKKENPEAKFSEDALKREEQQLAADKLVVAIDQQKEIQEKNEEIQELKESKDQLEKKVLEMKEELVKQNKETQQLVMQKFDEIAEKVEKIERQSADSAPSAKEKPMAKQEEADKLVDAPVENDLVPLHQVQHNDSEQNKEKKVEPNIPVIHKENDGENEDVRKIAKEPIKTIGDSLDNLSKHVKIEKDDHEKSVKSEVGADKPVNPETRGDPIVKLIKQEPLPNQVGEKMIESKNGSIELPKASDHLESSENEIKNEMRRKRDTLEDALGSLEKTLQNFEMKTIIGRDLKAITDET